MDEYVIIGAGSFGLHTALTLRHNEPNVKITIYEIDIYLSPSINSCNGTLNHIINYHENNNIKKQLISFKEEDKFNSLIYFNKISNIEWGLIYGIETLISNNKNRKIINSIININTDISKMINFNIQIKNKKEECTDSDYNDSDYWENIINLCLSKNINIVNNTEIINYEKINDKIILSTQTDKIECDKLILCTANNLKLIKNSYFHQFIETFSGVIITLKVKNQLKCYKYSNGMFISPYKDDMVKVGTHLEIGYNKGNYNLSQDDPDYNQIIEFIMKNNEVVELGVISVVNIWRGVRAMTYDILPFVSEIEPNIFWFTGGNYVGTHTANTFSMWLVQTILNKPHTDLPDGFNPRLSRLEKIRDMYRLFFVLLIF